MGCLKKSMKNDLDNFPEGGDMKIVKSSLILMRGVMTGRLYVTRFNGHWIG